MARFSMPGVNGFLRELERTAENIGNVAVDMLEEAAPILKEEVVKQATPHWYSGDMVNSITESGPHITEKGELEMYVHPSGVDHKGMRNMEKAAYLEYGTSTQRAMPFMKTATKNAEPKCIEKMREVFDREVGR